jgi:23S rRNA (cytosine1962-C5)-methyltransferase
MSSISTVILKPGRDKSPRQRHPWIYSGAIAKVDGVPLPGDIVRVVDDKNAFLAYGYYNQASQISVRLLEWSENEAINDEWWHRKLAEAISRRQLLAENSYTDAYRLVFGESDFLPGLIVDNYAEFLVTQFLTAGADKARHPVIAALKELANPAGIYDRSDADIRTLEGLLPTSSKLAGHEPSPFVRIKENDCLFDIDIMAGQKTGFYLDQRDSRQAVAAFAAGREILDCFCYTGGFSAYALSRGAKHITLVDSSANSLALARQNIDINDMQAKPVEYIEADVFKYLRDQKNAGRKYDMVILDPPKFAPSKANLKKALSGYKDINLLALNLLRPGGILATFSCSGAVSLDTLKTVIFWAANDANRQVQIIQSLSHGIDHPILASFPESEYLKGLICLAV